MNLLDKDNFFGSDEHMASVRQCTLNDVPWMVGLAKKKFFNINEQDTYEFLGSVIGDANSVILRSDSCCVGSIVYPFPYNRNILMAEDLFLTSDSNSAWEFYFLFKFMLHILESRGVREFKFDLSSFSSVRKSLEPLARRVGAHKTDGTYRIKFKVLH